MNQAMAVRHIFNYSFIKSLVNAFRKTMWWIIYSLSNRDLFADSGTASSELKVNGAVWLLNMLLLQLAISGQTSHFSRLLLCFLSLTCL